MAPRAQFVWALVGAAQYFVPAHAPGPAQPVVEQMQIQEAALLKRHIVAPEPQRSSAGVARSAWQSSAALVGGVVVAAAAATSFARSGRPARMQADAAMDPEALLPEESEEAPAPAPTPAPAPAAPKTFEMVGISAEVGGKVWDPIGFNEIANESTMAWFRHSELKHGRVCMMAFVGWLVQTQGGHFQGYFDLESKVSFASLSKLGVKEAWYAIPEKGKFQIIFLIGLIEWLSESTGPNGHYTKGGTPGDLTFIKGPAGADLTLGIPEDKREHFELAELKHGRLAMIGMASIFSASLIPGSVPILSALSS